MWWCVEAEEAVKHSRETRELLIRNPGNEEIMVAYAEKTAQAKKVIMEANQGGETESVGARVQKDGR